MSRFKDFGSGGDFSKEPITFKIHGEEFSCRPALQGKVLLDMVANSNEDDGAEMAKIVEKFFSTALEGESHKRLLSLLEDPEKIVTVETLGEIVGWLVEQYTARPTQEPEGS
jgi:hypothetical protein